MPRLFVGLEVPEYVRFRLALLSEPIPGAKWIDADSMHITLRFAADIDNRKADELVGFLDEIAAPPFEIRIGELGAFGGNEPRTIHVDVEGGEQLQYLHRATERAARSAGLAPETRAFKPHITLARLRGTRPNHVAHFLGSRAGLKLEPFPVERFVLFSSRPRLGGGPYVVENVFPLALG